MKIADGNIKYSFIIPSYNSEKVIGRCIESITKISVHNFEIIVVNDGSIDNTKNYVEALIKKDLRIKLINITNSGVSNARNIGLQNAIGEYVIFCDADDFYYYNNFSLVDSLIDKNNPDVLHFGYCVDYRVKRYIHKYSFKTDILYVGDKLKNELFWEQVINGDDCLNVWHMIVKRDVIEKIKFDCGLKYGEDTLFVLETMLNSNSIYFTDINLYNYEVNNSGAIGNINQDKLIEKINNIVEMYQKQYILINSRLISIDKKFMDKRCFEMILGDLKKLYYGSKHLDDTKEHFSRVLNLVQEEYIDDEIKKWYLTQNKKCFLIYHIFFKIKNIIKQIVLAR